MRVEYVKGLRMTPKRKNIVIAAQWFADNILGIAEMDATIQIVFCKNMLKDSSIFANCAWDKKLRIAVISIDADISKYLAFGTIAHEMVHAKQWITGELSHSRAGAFKWNDAKVSKKIAYHESPWEIEAMTKEVLMAHCFVHTCMGK